MARPDKVAAVKALTELFRSSSAVLLTEYRGLSVGQLKELRRALGDNATYTVAKNTLASIAAKEAGLEFLSEDLTGPTALAFVTGEPVDAAKALRDFAKDNKALVVKSGAMEGQKLSAEAVKQLADLESRDVLLAKAAGGMKAKLVQAAYMFKAPAVKTVRTVDALREKQEQAA
ncbi:50S ribosomal protein L10 [Boudabousia liubingyangii]|uniref:Large ribosomal subunit protein uL10 n=1 Tax=Boudabousia liubingyangii TaxID=1921764 RepID=A0A1Q5PQ79_9ACTO|nr:50S ribosomal protein L10 [Boudabousia liubingyangii]OKL48268.1 50S ribosomal protein L10 [Boudabousia liubingyangii]OKL49697.1 50S ribosomal protein L10 [Boudabousia liubingyangii]